ncbi:hypothetical protein QJQ45_003375 [Haematococcus lacustris]|nr:hypothetical protein QJQ45_003375 [Haematococcus lacustris]
MSHQAILADVVLGLSSRRRRPRTLRFPAEDGSYFKHEVELARLQAEAADLPPEVEATLTGRDVEPTLETTYQAGFQAHDLTGLTLGAKVMKDRDGRPAVRDPTFLAETQLVPKHLADRVFGDAAVAAGATQTVVLPNPDIPITLYSEHVATHK